MMKRLTALLLCGLMLLCAACGDGSADGGDPTGSGSAPTGSISPSPATSPSPSVEPSDEPTPPPPPEPTVATLAVCGDMMSHLPITTDAYVAETGGYDFYRMMEAAQPYVSAADYAVVNFETTMAGGPNYSGYPAFNAPDQMGYDLKELGFDLCLTSNNHSLDKGFSGLCRTLDMMDEIGLAHVGTSRTQEEYDQNWVVADVGGISVAFLGYTYGTNGIPLPSGHPYAVNLFNVDYMTTLSDLDEEKLAADLAAVEALGTDLIAVMIHWGWEYHTSQNSYQEQVADFLFEHGADIILGGHSHVPQPMEFRTITEADGTEKQGFIVYSLGNFISSQNDPLTDTTAVLTLELTRDNVTGVTQVTGCSYAPMLMLDREAGAYPRFELLDVYAELAKPDLSGSMRTKLEKAIADCHAILGEDHDAKEPVAPSYVAGGGQDGGGGPGRLTLSHEEFTISDRWPDPVKLRAEGAEGAVTWTSSDPSVATVDSDGTVTRVGAGRCTVTATDESGASDSCIVRCS